MKTPDTGKIISIVYLAGFLIALFVVYKILASVGIIKTAKSKRKKQEQEAAVEMLRTDEYFSPTFFKNQKYKSIGSNAANLYAQQLRKAIRGIGTDEEMIFSIFGRLFNKVNISEVAASYYVQYGNDLQADLLNDLNEKEITALMNIVNDLPNN